MDRAAEGAVLDLVDGAVEGEVHGEAEALRVRAAAQPVDRLRRDADPRAGLADAAALRQRLDHRHLPRRGQPVMAIM